MKINKRKLDIGGSGAFFIFASSSVIIPVCLPEIAQSLSTNLSESGSMEFVRAAVVLLITILSGILAGKWGKKRLITSGQYFLSAGLLLISYSQSYPVLLISIMITSIGGGITEALINPMIVDIHKKQAGKYLNITNAFFSIGIMISALIYGELLTAGVSWRTIFRIAAVGAIIVGIYMNSLHFPPAEQKKDSSLKDIGQILILPGFWFFATCIFLGAGIESAFTFWSRSYIKEYLHSIPRFGSMAIVIFSGMMAIGRLGTAKVATKLPLKRIIIYSSLLGLSLSMIIPLVTNLTLFYILLSLAGIATACFWPTVIALSAKTLSVNSTILIVLLTCFGIAGFGTTPWLMGILGDYSSLKMAFYIIPVLFAILSIITIIKFRKIKN